MTGKSVAESDKLDGAIERRIAELSVAEGNPGGSDVVPAESISPEATQGTPPRRPSHAEARATAKARKSAQPTAVPSGTSPNNGTPQGGDMTQQTIPTTPPQDAVSPQIPSSAPNPTSGTSLKALAKMYKKEGKQGKLEGEPLRSYVLARLKTTDEWKQATLEERNSALGVVKPVAAAATPESVSIRDRVRGNTSKPYAKVSILAGVLAAALLVGYQLIEVLVSLLFGSFAKSIGFTYPALVGGWASLKGGTVWILVIAAIVIGLLALRAYFKTGATQLPKAKLWAFGAVLVLAASLGAYPSGTAAAQQPVDHGSNLVITDMLYKACVAADPQGKFAQSLDVKSCAASLREKGRLGTSDTLLKQGYSGLGITAYLAACQAEHPGASTDEAITAYGGCFYDGIKQIYGQPVADLVSKG